MRGACRLLNGGFRLYYYPAPRFFNPVAFQSDYAK
jgi:hypothetical protein